MFDHQRDDFIVAQIFLAQFEFAIDRFAGAQQLAWRDAHLLNQLAQLLFAQRLDVIVDLAKVHAAFTKESIHFATLGTGWLFVNGDCVWHRLIPAGKMPAYRTHGCVRSNYGKIPRTRVASATRSMARMYAPVRRSTP